MRIPFILAACAALALTIPAAHAADTNAPATQPAQPVWELTAHAYRVLSNVTFFDAIDNAKITGLKYVEGRPYKISEETGKAELGPSTPAEVLEKVRKRLKEANLTLISYYAGDFGKNEREARRLFAFGKAMGIQFFVGEPRPEKLAMLDKLANEFGVNVAIHNHPKRPNNPAYAYWDPETIARMVAQYSKRIGCCADTGHWVRSGLDPVECLRKYEGRLVYLHLKDVSQKGPAGEDVVFGTGVADVKGMLRELHRQRFSGPISFEYDRKGADKCADVRRSAEVLKRIAKELAQKVQ